MSAGQGLEGGGEGLDHHHHARPAAEGRVVDLAVPAQAMLPEVDQVDVERARRNRPGHDADLQRAVEVLGKDGDDVDPHYRVPRNWIKVTMSPSVPIRVSSSAR